MKQKSLFNFLVFSGLSFLLAYLKKRNLLKKFLGQLVDMRGLGRVIWY